MSVKTIYYNESHRKAWYNQHYLYFAEDFKYGDELVIFAEIHKEEYNGGTVFYAAYNPRVGEAVTIADSYIVFNEDELDERELTKND